MTTMIAESLIVPGEFVGQGMPKKSRCGHQAIHNAPNRMRSNQNAAPPRRERTRRAFRRLSKCAHQGIRWKIAPRDPFSIIQSGPLGYCRVDEAPKMCALNWKTKDRSVTILNKGKRKIPVATLTEGYFLELKLPVRAFATLTTPHRLSRDMLDESFSAWIRGVQAHNRVTIGWIKSQEDCPQRHLHAVLIAPLPLDCSQAVILWQNIAAPRYKQAARVEPYRRGLCGIGYVLKALDSSLEDAQFSNAFSLRPAERNSLLRPYFR